MSALRVSPALLRAVAAANAVVSPLPQHHKRALVARSFDRLLSDGERWFLASILRLPQLSERQWARLQEIESKVERSR